VDRYGVLSSWSAQLIDEAPTARETALRLMRQRAINYTGETTPPGCLVATGGISCSSAASNVQHYGADARRGVEEKPADRIAKAVATDELPPDTDAPTRAAHVVSVIYGISTLARDGVTRATLLRIVESAMNPRPPECAAPLKAWRYGASFRQLGIGA
jgi:hypothetical protein